MDDPNVLRMLERLLVVGFGGLSIWLGYKLFDKTRDLAEGTFKTKVLELSLTRIGPGAFFALFGTFVLIQSLIAPIKTSSSRGESVEFFGATQQLAVSASEIETVARTQLALGVLNCLANHSEELRTALDAERFTLALNVLKGSVLASFWQSDWGDEQARARARLGEGLDEISVASIASRPDRNCPPLESNT